MNLNSPKVSVVMPVYNCEKYVGKAIESILNQTFGDFEFIIIDDGSVDGSADILARYQQIDSRIQLYHQENQGIDSSRNRGCGLARGKYIAVMDSDDISLPERFAKEVSYMETHPEIGVLGSWSQVIDGDDRVLRGRNVRSPTSPRVMGWFLLFTSCVDHSSVMMRRELVEKLGFYQMMDYDLYARANNITQIANLPGVLLQYRVWEGNDTKRNLQTNTQNVVKIMYSQMVQLLGPDVPAEAVMTLRQVQFGLFLNTPDSIQQIDQADNLIHQLYRAYLRSNSLNPKEVKEIAQDAGIKLVGLASVASGISLRKGLVIFARAVRMYPQILLSRQIISKGVTKGVNIMLRKA